MRNTVFERQFISVGCCEFELVGSVGLTSPEFPIKSEPGEYGVGFRMLSGIGGPVENHTYLEVQSEVWDHSEGGSDLVVTYYRVNEKGQLQEVDLTQLA